MKIAITGGAGYVGSKLTPYLLNKGHQVTVLDTFWYGDYLENHPNLRKIKGDIRNRNDLRESFRDQNAVIHLACVSNDPSFDMNPSLGKQINYDCFQEILTILAEQNIGRFIYASSSSVYGVSPLPDVPESAPKNPLTDYSKYKRDCESMLKSYGIGGGIWTILRPATVCGYAPRQRLDLVVNILTMQAIVNKKITLFGREQKRPNIYVDDMVRAYEFILEADEKKIDHEIYNVGFENLTLWEIANLVKETIGDPEIEIIDQPTNDPRSYHINSDKIKALGFSPLFNIAGAISSLADNFSKLENPMTNSNFYNIRKMKELGL